MNLDVIAWRHEDVVALIPMSTATIEKLIPQLSCIDKIEGPMRP